MKAFLALLTIHGAAGDDTSGLIVFSVIGLLVIVVAAAFVTNFAQKALSKRRNRTKGNAPNGQ